MLTVEIQYHSQPLIHIAFEQLNTNDIKIKQILAVQEVEKMV